MTSLRTFYSIQTALIHIGYVPGARIRKERGASKRFGFCYYIGYRVRPIDVYHAQRYIGTLSDNS